MTNLVIDSTISDFLHGLVYEAQLLSFQKKLLHSIKNNDLRKYADDELKKIKSHIHNGTYKPQTIVAKGLATKAKAESRPNQDVKNSDTSVALKHKPIILNKTFQKKVFNVGESNNLRLDYKILTYEALANKIDIKLLFLNRLVISKGKSFSLEPDAFVSTEVWDIIEEFVLNKLKIINSIKKREQIVNQTSKRKVVPSSSPLRQFVGGNFGKLIYIGKIR